MKSIICEQCKKEASDGYVEMVDPLTEDRVKVCFECARENDRLKKALEADDELANTSKKEETEYMKALRTGILPDIWTPIRMTREDLDHFRKTFCK